MAAGMRVRQLVLVVSVMSMVLLFRPPVAQAHAGFISSVPEPGASLGSAPGVVALRFSEPLNVQLSQATVTGPDGRVWTGTTTEGEMSVTLSTDAPGVYDVGWKTVSLVDGHALTGSFRFGVGVKIEAGAEGETNTSPRPVDLLVAAGRALEDIALFLAAGLVLIGRLAPEKLWVRARPQKALTVALVSGMAVVVGEAVAAAASPSVSTIVSYLTTGLPGIARLARPALELGALAVAILRPRWCAVPLACVFVALAVAGHAAVVRPSWWGIGVEAVHVAATAMWAGGIMALAFQRPPGGWRGAEGRALLDRFTPVALFAFAASITSGAIRGAEEIGSFSALVTSSYGVTLLVKILLVTLMIQLSILAWRRILVRPRWEMGVAVFAVGAATLLAAFPIPPARLAEAERVQEESIQGSALPEPGDLTLGGHAGGFLVGLTIRSDPGRLLVFVRGLQSDADTAARTVGVTLNGDPLRVTQCAPTCRQVDQTVREGDDVAVSVAGTGGGTADFHVPDPKSPEADGLLARMHQRMQQLSTYRVNEELSSGAAVADTRYAFQAPDRLSTVGEQGGRVSRLVWIGPTRYLRSTQTASWTVENNAASPTVPTFLWDSFQPLIDARKIGVDEIDGVPTDVVVCFGGQADLPVWFRLWIDRAGLVRRAQMRAQGHFMNETYSAFDHGFEILPPGGAT
jgi:copper transport protein